MATILVTEDDPDIRGILVLLLEQIGKHTVLMAENGQAAIAIAETAKPDLILMDLNMPVLDGWKATAWLKNHPDTHTIPILAVTAHGLGEEGALALTAGCDAIITKPVDVDELLRVIKDHLERKTKIDAEIAANRTKQ